MRPVLFLPLLLAACAPPEIAALSTPEISRSAYPRLVPATEILSQVPGDAAGVIAATGSLRADAARLDASAGALDARATRVTAGDTSLTARATNLRARADALRGPAITEDERTALRRRLATLREEIGRD